MRRALNIPEKTCTYESSSSGYSICNGVGNYEELSMSGLGPDLLLLSQFLSGLSDPTYPPIPEFLSVLDPT